MMAREQERIEAMRVLQAGIDQTLAGGDATVNRLQERILRSVAAKETAAPKPAADDLPLIRGVPIPARMAHLPKDRRGYPVPAMVLVDDGGRPHFQINDERIRQRLIQEDRCVICGTKLLRGRWFVGGHGSAFSQRGLYIDPPTHSECVDYALRVCPYLAAPNYGKEIGDRTMKGRTAAGVVTTVDPTVIEGRPPYFVAVMAVGQDYVKAQGQFADIRFEPDHVRYVRHHVSSVRQVRVWQHGSEVTDRAVLAEFGRWVVSDLAERYGEAPRADMLAAFERSTGVRL